MILQALARYYEILANDPDSEIAPPMYSKAGVSYAINLSAKGDILDIFPLEYAVKRGNKSIDVPLRMIVPEQLKRSGQKPPPNFLCDNSMYVLGISDKGQEDNGENSRKRFELFREFHLKMLTNVASPQAQAVVKFLQKYDPAQGRDHPAIKRYCPFILQGKNLVFRLDGYEGYIHETTEIRQIWEKYRSENASLVIGQCLVSGEMLPIARLHPSIKGVKGANPTGGTLVGFNDHAYESYNRVNAQGLNSPTSEKSAFAYTTALNYLLSAENPNPKINMGDTTVVYWAESPDKIYESIFLCALDPDYAELVSKEETQGSSRDHAAEQRLKEIAQKIKSGAALDAANLLAGLDADTRFYVLGLTPNAARISVRFFHADPFQKIVAHIQAHYEDMSIVQEYNQERRISLYRILQETVSKKASDKSPSPLMGGAVMRAILSGTPYPAALYYALINRVRADNDDAKAGIQKVNSNRAAIIKAYLLRKYRRQNIPEIQEVLCMKLNEQSTNKAYLLGRLFAVLEKAQQDAAYPAKLNATIKDRFFTSACASPATVFPLLLRLSQHHISKAQYGYASDRLIEQIFNQIAMEGQPIPTHLNLDEQGIFVLGYYHQRQAFYVKKENPQPLEETH